MGGLVHAIRELKLKIYRLSPYFERFSAIFEKIRALFYTQMHTKTASGKAKLTEYSFCLSTYSKTKIYQASRGKAMYIITPTIELSFTPGIIKITTNYQF